MNQHPNERQQQRANEGQSLIRRAVLGIVLAELICLVALAALSVAHERKVRLRAMSVMLQGRTDSLFGAIQDAEDQGDSVRLDAREITIPRGDFFAIYDEAGRPISVSDKAPPELVRLRGVDEPPFQTHRVGRHSYRVLQRGYVRVVDRDENQAGGLLRPVTIVYATEIDRIWREIFEAIEFYLGISLVLTLVTTLIIVAFLRSALRPISALATAAAAVSPRNLDFVAPPAALAIRELRPLALTLTSMVGELRLAIDRQHRFLGDATHELKTAVAVVRSSLQLMLLRPRSAAAYEKGLESAVADNERAEQLIARMLLMARLEEPEAPQQGQGDAEQAVRACVRKLGPVMEQAEVRVEVSWPSSTEEDAQRADGRSPESHLVAASPEDLEILFSNLLANAAEHSAAGSLVTVRAEESEAGIWVRISDQGDGIAMEAQAHIFERFFRADQSRARKTGGAGLGLSIAKAIVDSACGTISVASKVNEGTVMTVYLPFVAVDGPLPRG